MHPPPATQLDAQALERLQEMEAEGYFTVREFVDLFATESADRLQQLVGAVEAGDIEAAHRQAHSLKSAGLEVGARAMASLAEQIERLAREQNLAGCAELTARLQDAYASTRAELSRLGLLTSTDS